MFLWEERKISVSVSCYHLILSKSHSKFKNKYKKDEIIQMVEFVPQHICPVWCRNRQLVFQIVYPHLGGITTLKKCQSAIYWFVWIPSSSNPVDNDVKQHKHYNDWTKSHPHGLLISFHQIRFSLVHKHLLVLCVISGSEWNKLQAMVSPVTFMFIGMSGIWKWLVTIICVLFLWLHHTVVKLERIRPNMHKR